MPATKLIEAIKKIGKLLCVLELIGLGLLNFHFIGWK
jgi:hypothetical protein